jgi:exoribonuclease-2
MPRREDESGEDEEEVAGPIAIAVDLSDSEAAPENTPTPA